MLPIAKEKPKSIVFVVKNSPVFTKYFKIFLNTFRVAKTTAHCLNAYSE